MECFADFFRFYAAYSSKQTHRKVLNFIQDFYLIRITLYFSNSEDDSRATECAEWTKQNRTNKQKLAKNFFLLFSVFFFPCYRKRKSKSYAMVAAFLRLSFLTFVPALFSLFWLFFSLAIVRSLSLFLSLSVIPWVWLPISNCVTRCYTFRFLFRVPAKRKALSERKDRNFILI